MITLIKDRPEFDTNSFRQLHEPVYSIEELQALSFGVDSKCLVICNRITYLAYYMTGPNYWIVIPSSCEPHLELVLQFELNRTYKVRVDT